MTVTKPPQDSPDFPNAFYRISVKGLCLRDGKVLLLHDFTGLDQGDKKPEWELPGGGLDFGENFHDALRREVREEMGLTIAWISETPVFIWTTKRTGRRGLEWYWICTVIFRIEFEDLKFTPSGECREILFFSKEELQANITDLASQVKPLAEHLDPNMFIGKGIAPKA